MYDVQKRTSLDAQLNTVDIQIRGLHVPYRALYATPPASSIAQQSSLPIPETWRRCHCDGPLYCITYDSD